MKSKVYPYTNTTNESHRQQYGAQCGVWLKQVLWLYCKGRQVLGPSLLFFLVVCFRIGNLKLVSHRGNLSHCRNMVFLPLANGFSICRISLWCQGRNLHLLPGLGDVTQLNSPQLVWVPKLWCCYCSLSSRKLFWSPYRVPQPFCASASPRDLWGSHNAFPRCPNILKRDPSRALRYYNT